MNRKGQMIYMFVLFIILTVVVVVGAYLSPLGTRINAEFFIYGERMMLDANDTISMIQNAELKSALRNSTEEALEATATNIEVTNTYYQYIWLIAAIVVTLVTFLGARQLVEFQGGGGIY